MREWAARHWGVEAELSPATRVADDGVRTLVFEFVSEGGPPEPWLDHVSPAFPDLTFTLEYLVPVLGFAGRTSCAAGRLLERLTPPDDESLSAFAHTRFGVVWPGDA